MDQKTTSCTPVTGASVSAQGVTWWVVESGQGSITKEGHFPSGLTQSELIDILKGDMGGRFQMFVPAGPNKLGRFRYVAYTSGGRCL